MFKCSESNFGVEPYVCIVQPTAE